MIRKLRALVVLGAGLGLALGLGLTALAAPAMATDTPGPACGTWTLYQATEAYPAPLTKGEGNSSNDKNTATLVKPDGDPAVTGVEFSAKDLEIDGPTTIKVDYAMSDGATPAAGAVRLFGYEDQDANTLTDTPTYGPAVADAETGTLTLTVTGPLGTLGLAYDASNSTTGTVLFSNLRVGDLSGKFEACPEPEETGSPSPGTGGPSPLPSLTAGPTRGPIKATPTPSFSMLPVTGDDTDGTNPLAILLPIGGVLLLAGAAAVVLTRERRKGVHRA